MESKWVISFEDIVYLIISAGMVCLIITWMFSGLLVSNDNYDFEPLNAPSNRLIPESVPQIEIEYQEIEYQEIEYHSPPIVPQQHAHALHIHPLKVVRIHSKTNTALP